VTGLTYKFLSFTEKNLSLSYCFVILQEIYIPLFKFIRNPLIMKQKHKFPILLSLLLAIFSGLSAQNLVVKLNNGDENMDGLGEIRTLTFGDNNLMVNLKNGSTDTYMLEDVRKLYFSNTVSVEERKHGFSNMLSIYPNPASETLRIDGIPGGSKVIRIYQADGTLVISEPVSSDHVTVDIRRLAKGLYFIQCEGYNAKFIRL